jgi:hypothetical protein
MMSEKKDPEMAYFPIEQRAKVLGQGNGWPNSPRMLSDATNGDVKPIDYYQRLIESRLESGEFELFAPGVTQVQLDDGTTATFRHISVMLALTLLGDPEQRLFEEIGLESFLAILMAMQHFNNRIPAIVPEIKELGQCDIKFSLDLFDSQFSPLAAVAQLTEEIIPRGDLSLVGVTNATMYPTGILGASRSDTSGLTSIISGIYDITQVAFQSSADSLDNKDIYPRFGRVITPASTVSGLVADYFKEELKATHVFVLYVGASLGLDFFTAFQNRASELGIIVNSTSLPGCRVCDDADSEVALKALKESGYKYVYAILLDPNFSSIAPLAVENGLTGEDMFWLYAQTFAFPPLYPNSTVLDAVDGSAVIGLPLDSLYASYETYQKEWKTYIAKNETRAFMDSLMPPTAFLHPGYAAYEIPPSSETSSFAYDAFMAMALSACDASASVGANFSADAYWAAFLKVNFTGATEALFIEPKTASRATESQKLFIYNVLRDANPPDNVTGLVNLYPLTPTHNYSFDARQGLAKWFVREGVQFLYAGNTVVPPPGLPPVGEENFEIATWASIFGYVACVVVIVITLGFSIWIQQNNKLDPIRAAQPFFVWMLAIGVALMSISLIPRASVPSSTVPDAVCMMTPWFLSIGFSICFAALFSKLMRINSIQRASKKMRRVVIKPYMVLKPFLFMLLLNLIILVTWTAVSPLKYDPTPLDDLDRFGRLKAYTWSCDSDNALWFRIVIGLVNIAAVAVTAYQSYICRNTKMAYNESSYIYFSILIASQSFLIGIPGVIAAQGNPTTEFFCYSLATVWGCLGLVLPIMAPKVVQVREWREQKKLKETKRAEKKKRVNEYFDYVTSLKNSVGTTSGTSENRPSQVRFASNQPSQPAPSSVYQSSIESQASGQLRPNIMSEISGQLHSVQE